jgi:hypothetical protein
MVARLYRFSSDVQSLNVKSQEIYMSEQTSEKPQKQPKSKADRGTPIGRLALGEVDAALVECERVIKTHTDTVKSKLTASASIPPAALRELSRANSQRARLAMRRIALLLESGDAAVADLIEKLMKVRPKVG